MSRAPWHRRPAAIDTLGGRIILISMQLAVVATAGLALFAGCSSCAHGATLTIRGTAPAFDNGGTCAVPISTPAAVGALVTVHVEVTGPAAFADSLQVVTGGAFTFARTVPSGTYTVRAWARDAGGIGCDTLVTVTVKNPPGRVRL